MIPLREFKILPRTPMIGVLFFVHGETTFCHGNIMTPKETMVLIDKDAMTLGIERENIFFFKVPSTIYGEMGCLYEEQNQTV